MLEITSRTMKTPQKPEMPDWVLAKMQQFCSFQERCLLDVKSKLKTFHLQEGIDEQVILHLKKENFLDEARYARVFATGKIRNNKWGKIKIYAALQQKQVPEFFILQGLTQIDENEYIKILTHVIKSKNKLLKEKDSFRRNQKLAKFAVGKGFEANVVWKVITGMEV